MLSGPTRVDGFVGAGLLAMAGGLEPEQSITLIAKTLGISVGTLYNHIPDLKELRTSRVPKQYRALKGVPAAGQ
ncbi:hypothetical protein ACFXA3_21550 [Streptomyces sp. NPDC059456]|uniref:hypothetical protein n=1 Tax=Streptomyces sp. NPDC059456 TaxID=3346838 RepID=UPI0036B7EC2F